jgi:hypothetical protein
LCFGAEVRGYEITGAYEAGRLIGKEYKDAIGGPAMRPDNEWAVTLADVPDAIRRATKLKLEKRYPSAAAGLVVYVQR